MGKSTDPNDQAKVTLLCGLFSIYASSAAVMIDRSGASAAEASPWCHPTPNPQPIA